MKCSIGKSLGLVCSDDKFKRRSSFSARDLELFQARCGVVVSSVCSKHDELYRSRYEKNQRLCSNPFGLADHNARKNLRTVSEELYDQCKAILPHVVEGQKLCISCRKKVNERLSSTCKPDIINPTIHSGSHSDSNSDLSIICANNNHHTEPFKLFGAGSITEPTSAHDGRIPLHHDELNHLTSNLRSATPMDHPRTTSLTDTPLSTTSGEGERSSGSTYSPIGAKVEKLSAATSQLGVSPIDPKKLNRSSKYATNKEQQVIGELRTVFKNAIPGVFHDKTSLEHNIDFEGVGREFISRLQHLFKSATCYKRKLQILSLSPSTWSIRKIMTEFGATRRMVERSRTLVKDHGILFEESMKTSRPLPQIVLETVRDFYREPDISRELPGMKEFVSVNTEDGRVHLQKRLMLINLNEAYAEFKNRHENIKIGRTKFAELRPKECVFAGASGTHVVCVCEIHQNFKYMFEAGQLYQIKDVSGNILFPTYRELLFATLCLDPREICFRGLCNLCPGMEHLKEIIENFYEENFVEEITYSSWVKVDRSKLETFIKSVDDFLDTFFEYIPKLVLHDYIGKKQSKQFKETRDNLGIGEVVVVADFSENYKFVIQTSIQGVHWNNDSATIFPFACYYRPENEERVKPLNFVIISDIKEHTTTVVYTFQEKLITFLKQKIRPLSKIFYFSDGATAHFKNRFNVINLLYHEKDFGVAAEWHFFATSHGKGPSDGLGGTTKRLVARASLQLPPEKQIQTPQKFFSWANENIKGIKYGFVSKEEVATKEEELKSRFEEAPEIKGIRSFHAAIPMSRGNILMKPTSSSIEGTTYTLVRPDSVHLPSQGGCESRPGGIIKVSNTSEEITSSQDFKIKRLSRKRRLH